ncbi:hypothetical protein ACFL0V_02980 [Nanoarchaeota archaeon]
MVGDILYMRTKGPSVMFCIGPEPDENYTESAGTMSGILNKIAGTVMPGNLGSSRQYDEILYSPVPEEDYQILCRQVASRLTVAVKPVPITVMREGVQFTFSILAMRNCEEDFSKARAGVGAFLHNHVQNYFGDLRLRTGSLRGDIADYRVGGVVINSLEIDDPCYDHLSIGESANRVHTRREDGLHIPVSSLEVHILSSAKRVGDSGAITDDVVHGTVLRDFQDARFTDGVIVAGENKYIPTEFSIDSVFKNF